MAQSVAILQLAASLEFSPFKKILTRPSFAEAYLGHKDPPTLCLGPPFLFLHGGRLSGWLHCGPNTLRIHTAIIFSVECKHSATVERPHTEPCCHVCSLFARGTPPAMSVTSLGALAPDRLPSPRPTWELRLWLRTCEIPLWGKTTSGGGWGVWTPTDQLFVDSLLHLL